VTTLKLFRTTVFRLSVVYLAVFSALAAMIILYVGWQANQLLTQETVGAIEQEVQGLRDQYDRNGMYRLEEMIDASAARPSSSLYLLVNVAGEMLAGNIGAVPSDLLVRDGWAEMPYRKLDETGQPKLHRALVRVVVLSNGSRLLVGRDIEEREQFRGIIGRVMRWSFALVVALGLAGGVFVSRRVLKRIDAMTETSRTIMAGDLSGRIPVAGSDDELDRLAQSLNLMLERIDELMRGMKEVSDNIAHDLKTPLTRLRQRAEAALREPPSAERYREALQQTLVECDQLMRIFDALLMIARAEAGQARDAMAEVDVTAVAQDVAELYEPLADERGLSLEVRAEPGLRTRGNRELLGQALANLVDNAIKYGAPGGAPPATGGSAPPALNGKSAVVIAARNGGGVITLSVADHGPGIPETDRDRVLDRFVRLEASRTRPGSGLGLSLAAAVARLHGGLLRLRDNAPGLRAEIELPMTGAPA
jgi:signal transduction histidine kinase